jgi:hypothetical protein
MLASFKVYVVPSLQFVASAAVPSAVTYPRVILVAEITATYGLLSLRSCSIDGLDEEGNLDVELEGKGEDAVLLLLLSEVVELTDTRESDLLFVRDELAETEDVTNDNVVTLFVPALLELRPMREAELDTEDKTVGG